MPRKLKLKRSGGGWTSEHIRILKTGHDYFETFRGDDEQRTAWHDLRGEILPAWITERPGTRPHAWWMCECPAGEFRRRVDGGTHPHFRRSWADPERRMHFGKPSVIMGEDRDAQYETERAFFGEALTSERPRIGDFERTKR